MSIKQNIGYTAAGVSLAELIHKITGKTPLENISHLFSQKKRDEYINQLLKEAGNLSTEERNDITTALNYEPIFRIVAGIDKPEDRIDKEIEKKAELRLKDIKKNDEDTYSVIMSMKMSFSFGVSRMNRLNKFLVDNSVEDTIRIHNLLRAKFPGKFGKFEEEYHDKLYTAFNFHPTEEDEIENYAYLVQKLLNRELTDIAATQMDITVQLNNKYGMEIINKYIKFLKFIRNNDISEHKKFIKMMREKYTKSPEETLNLINEAMKNDSNSVRKKIFELS